MKNPFKGAERMASIETLCLLAFRGQRGRGWYADAYRTIERTGDKYDVNAGYLADLCAVYSPRVHVSRANRLALAHARTRTPQTVGILPTSARAAIRYQEEGVLSGPKVRAFAAALKGDPDALVMDVWMAHALGVPQAKVNSGPTGRKARHRVRAAADRLGWSVAETQAAIWCGTMERAGRNDSPFIF